MMPFSAKNPSQPHQFFTKKVKKRSGPISIYGGLSKKGLQNPPYKAEFVHFLNDSRFLPRNCKNAHLLTNWILYLPTHPLNKAPKTGKTPHIH